MATLTVYPDPNPETTSVDGFAIRGGVNQTFANIRSGAGTSASDFDATNDVLLLATTTTDQFDTLRRSFLLFDTSALTADATISAAVLSLFGNTKISSLGSPDIHIASSTPASSTAIAAADYSQIGTTSFGNVTYAGYSTVAYNDFTLNASGITNISKTGVSKFSAQLSWDINNSFTGVWLSSASSALGWSSAETVGTTSDPKLVVTYTLPFVFVPQIIIS